MHGINIMLAVHSAIDNSASPPRSRSNRAVNVKEVPTGLFPGCIGVVGKPSNVERRGITEGDARSVGTAGIAGASIGGGSIGSTACGRVYGAEACEVLGMGSMTSDGGA